METSQLKWSAFNCELIHAFEQGVDDGFFMGNSNDTCFETNDVLREA